MDNQTHHTANSKALVGTIKAFAGLIVIAAIVYSEILFLGIVGNLFPSGPLAVGAVIGAITTGLSILALCLAKSHWFRPGYQIIVAWCFTILEIAVLIANDILAYELHTGQKLDQYTDTWRTFCVAAPVLSLIGWVLLFYFSPERAIAHKRMEMEDDQKSSQIDFEALMHKKAMAVQKQAANMVGSRLEAKIERHMEYQLDRAASRFAARIASQLTGEHVSSEDLGGSSPKQVTGRIIDADTSPRPAIAASKDHVVDPHEVKPAIDSEVKPLERRKSLLESFHNMIGKTIFGEKEIDNNSNQGRLTSPEEDYGSVEQEIIEEQPIEQEWKSGDPLPDNYLEWTDGQWKQAKMQLDAFDFAKKFDEAFPDETPIEEPKKKGKGGRKPKNGGTGNQGE